MNELTPDERLLTALIRKVQLAQDIEIPGEVGSDEWPRLIDVAIRHRLAPLLYASVAALGMRESLPEESRERLTAEYMRSGLANMHAVADLAALLPVFASHGVPIVALKGVAVAQTLYADPALRPFNDIDILARPAQREMAAACLLSQGYAAYVPNWGPGLEHTFDHGQHFQRQAEHTSTVDLHWHLLNPPYYRRHADIDWFWNRSASMACAGSPLPCLAPGALFVHLGAHLKLHHPTIDLLRTFDLALCLKQHADSMDWDEILSVASSFKLTAVLQAACDDVGACWGVSPPPPIASRLAASHPGKVENLVYQAYTNPRTRLAPLVDLWFRPGLRAKLRYARDMLFPAESYLRQILPPSERNAPLFFLHARRLRRSIFTVLRSARGLLPRRGRQPEIDRRSH